VAAIGSSTLGSQVSCVSGGTRVIGCRSHV
jgi:hypothetical protein